MKERPAIFSAPMVRAILEGRNFMTRRIIKKQPAGEWAAPGRSACPYGVTGDRLWVREAWDFIPESESTAMIRYWAGGDMELRVPPVDYNPFVYNGERKRPSIHMPRWASRITLEIVNVRVERLQAITEEDAVNEGAQWLDFGKCGRGYPLAGWSMEHPNHHAECFHTARMAFANFISKLHGGDRWNLKPSNLWNENPWVWVIEFRRV